MKQYFVVGYLTSKDGRKIIRDIKTDRIVNARVKQKALSHLPPFTLFKLNMNGEILEVLGHIEDSCVDEKISLALYGISDSFSKEALAQTRTCEEYANSSDEERIDLRHLPFCTIDPEDAKDFDDALYYDSIKGELYVAIADVSAYIQPFSPIDIEAYNRGFSIYFPHRCIPMLPPQLSEELCSLKPHTDRLVYVWKIHLHRGYAKVLRQESFLGIIRSQKRFTYTEVEAILQNPKFLKKPKNPTKRKQADSKQPLKQPPPPSLEENLYSLHTQMQKVRKRRLKNGFIFLNEEEKIIWNPNPAKIKFKRVPHSCAHELVEEAMLLANLAAAEQLSLYFPHGIYRSHSLPSQQKLSILFEQLRFLDYKAACRKTPRNTNQEAIHESFLAIQKEAKKRNEQKEIDRLLIKAQAQAQYTIQNSSHFGLGFPAYAHFTSPIRRYSDLFLHRILKKFLTSHKVSKLLKKAQKTCARMNVLEKISTAVELDFKDRIYARFARENIGQQLECIVIDSRYPALAQVQNKMIGARVLIDDSCLQEQDRVLVRIVESDVLHAKILCRTIKKI